MFTNKTAFILGAGASWHYGYPTGEGLVSKISDRARMLSGFFRESANSPYGLNMIRPAYVARNTKEGLGGPTIEQRRKEWIDASKEADNLIARLQQVSPLVIDSFLGHNPTLRPIGKLLIAWVIMECEAEFIIHAGNPNRLQPGITSGVPLSVYPDNWYRFVLHKLTSGCNSSQDLLRNDVRFVTFNYDVSLETFLSRGLSAIELFDESDVNHFLSAQRILHVYGQIRENHGAGENRDIDPRIFASLTTRASTGARGRNDEKYRSDFCHTLDILYRASQKIRTIEPSDKSLDADTIEAARQFIAEANCVYILGYGFDEQNSRRLNLYESLRLDKRRRGQCVLFTNFDDVNRINKKASKLFFGHPREFLDTAAKGDPLSSEFYCEKSTRTVYEALAQDFDSLEEQLTAGTPI